jgi:hypothetical protein
MPWEKLNLFQLSTCTMAQAGTATAQIVWGEPVDPGTQGTFLYDIPDNILSYS